MKRRLLVVIIFSMVLATTACGGASGADSTGTYEGATNSFMAKEAAGFEEAAAESYDMDVDATTDEGGEEVDLSGYDTSRKLVYNSNISLESKKFDEDVAKIEDIIENPQKFDIPSWMLNRREDYETGDDIHLIESDLDMILRDDLNRMKKTRSYKGRRHEVGLPVRGQRTKSTFRKSSSVGVKRSRG